LASINSTDVEKAFYDAINNNGNINAYTQAEWGVDLLVSRADDYMFINEVEYPFCNVMCVGKAENNGGYIFNIDIQVLTRREFLPNGILDKTTEVEPAKDKIDGLTSLIEAEYRQELLAFGIGAWSDVVVNGTSTQYVAPDGSSESLLMLNYATIAIEKCL